MRSLRQRWATTVTVALCAMLGAGITAAEEVEVSLTGAQEVPAVETDAEGYGTIVVGDDRSISGSVTTKGMDGIAAHIHFAPAGENGPPIIPLVNDGDGVWSVPAETVLTEEQYQDFLEGNLYVNVHSEFSKRGEIRGQLNP